MSASAKIHGPDLASGHTSTQGAFTDFVTHMVAGVLYAASVRTIRQTDLFTISHIRFLARRDLLRAMGVVPS